MLLVQPVSLSLFLFFELDAGKQLPDVWVHGVKVE
jgi:hypothetical protein